MITVTASAIAQIKKLAIKQNLNDYFFRVAIQSGGCNGFQNLFEFCQSPVPPDITWVVEGVKFISDPKSFKLLNGMQVDFVSTLIKKSFVIQDPNQKIKSCSCGASFSL